MRPPRSPARTVLAPALALAAGAVVFLCGAPLAQAAPRISVLGIDSDSAVRSGIQEATTTAAALTKELRDLARSTPGFSYTTKPDTGLSEAKLSYNCFDEGAACMGQIADSLDAAVILWGSVFKRKDGSYLVQLHALDRVQGGAPAAMPVAMPVAMTEKLPPKPSGDELAALAQRAFAKLLHVSSGAALRLAANVEGATVAIDGVVVGTTGAAGASFSDVVTPGRHKVVVAKDGYQPISMAVDVPAEGTSVAATLVAQPTVQIVATQPPPESGGSEAAPPAAAAEPAPVEQPALPPAPAASGAGSEAALDESSPRHPWRTAFWAGALVTAASVVGATAGGINVLLAQNDKNAELQHIMQLDGGPARQAFGPSASDVCSAANTYKPVGSGAYVAQLKSTCSTGQTSALFTNLFIGTAVAGAAFSTFAYYEGYHKSPSEEAPPATARAHRIHVAPLVGRGNGGLWAWFDF